jgi:hypothetical protein
MIEPIIGDWLPLRTEKKKKILASQARRILEVCNDHNRPVPTATVVKVSAALRGEEGTVWKYNGEPIIFDKNGRLLDGQGRLTACMETGIPLITDVSFGHDPEAFDSIDRGKIRNEADDLALIGEKNTRALSAVLKIICAYLDGYRNSVLVCNTYNFKRMKETLDRYPSIRDSVMFSNNYKGKILCAPRVVAAVHFFAGLNASPKALVRRDEFFARLSDGTNLSATDPVYSVREKFFTMARNPDARVKRGMGGLTVMTYLHALTRAWNAYLSGNKLGKIQLVYSDDSKTTLSDLPDIKNGYRMQISREDLPDQPGLAADSR